MLKITKKIVALLGLFILILCCGCENNGGKKDEQVRAELTNEVDLYIEAVRNSNYDELNSYYGDFDCYGEIINMLLSNGSQQTKQLYSIMAEYASKIEYSIQDVEYDEGTATVLLKYSYEDASPIVACAIKTSSDKYGVDMNDIDNDSMQLLISEINEAKNTMSPLIIDDETTIHLEKNEDVWTITEVPEEFYVAPASLMLYLMSY